MAGEKSHARLWILVAVIVVALAVGGYFWLTRKQPQQPTGPPQKATLGVETSVISAAVWVAENKRYFQAEGLDLNIKLFETGKSSLSALLKGEGIDICTVAPTPIMFSSFARQDFCIFATFAYSDEDVKVIARGDRGIAAARDLRGKKVGTAAGTTGHFVLEAFLTFNRMSASDVEMIDIAPSDLPGALQSNQVDAIVIWEPHAYEARQLLGNKVSRLPSSQVYRETFNFMVMKDFARDNPEALTRFLRAIERATTFIRNHRQESQALVAKRLKLDKKAVTALWNDFVFNISLDQSLILTLEDEARWAIAKGLTGKKTEVPNYLDYVHTDVMEKVKPEAITIIR